MAFRAVLLVPHDAFTLSPLLSGYRNKEKGDLAILQAKG
jgi:hypothetical protein